MQYDVSAGKMAGRDTDALIVPVFEGDKPAGKLEEVDALLGGLLGKVLDSGEFEPKLNKTMLLHTGGERVLLIGGGKRKEHDFDKAQQLAGAAVRALPGICRSAAFVPRGDLAPQAQGQAVSEGAGIALFRPDFYKSDRKDPKLERIELLAGKGDAKAVERGLEDGQALAEAVNFARRLADEPSNLMTPTHLAEAATTIAGGPIAVQVLEREDMERMSMGSLLGVAKGSDEPPKLIVMRYKAPKKSKVTVALVGKGITFDTGGISLKPATHMDEMKTDMSGGAAVIGAMRTLAHFRPDVNVLGIVPATENMPGGHAIKPGDVLRASNGKTIEVLNTDAEGRLVLADGIIYARNHGATHLVDIATLTGAIVTALGKITTGVFGNNQEWTDQLLAAAKRAGEKMWQMPMFQEYADMMKGDISDLKNISGSTEAGSITAAGFLMAFAEDTPWVHLDIAGTARAGKDRGYMAKGATGAGLRTMVELVRGLS
ncbi:MAG TPA: leucyl aminopeptidase [Chloroflexota bacterium]|nr:leucyl aminopeptidase [Chloroflexota bacterium]